MTSTQTVMLISDVHTKYDVINQQVCHAESTLDQPLEQVFVLGDFGFFGDPMGQFFRRQNQRFLRPVTCIDGNHDDHGALEDLAEGFGDVVKLRKRGQLHALGSRMALCLGGARYMDASATPRGSEINERDIQKSLAYPADDVDLILTHDCPPGIGVPGASGQSHYGPTGVQGLEKLGERYRPQWWFFGHHHRWFDHQSNGTRYVGLPQSWLGYVLLNAPGEVTLVENHIPLDPVGRWARWLKPGQW